MFVDRGTWLNTIEPMISGFGLVGATHHLTEFQAAPAMQVHYKHNPMPVQAFSILTLRKPNPSQVIHAAAGRVPRVWGLEFTA